jgi:hypothetical protein
MVREGVQYVGRKTRNRHGGSNLVVYREDGREVRREEARSGNKDGEDHGRGEGCGSERTER